MFGGCDSRACVINRIVIGFFNLLMGILTLGWGYYYKVTALIVIGCIIAAMGLLMVLLNLIALRRAKPEPEPEQEIEPENIT